MATYKVIQDIEADDKFLGPLSLKQFIYAAVTAICLYSSFYSLSKGMAWVLPILLPPGFITGFLAFPWGRDQSTETWMLAKIRFHVKPRVRIWDQSGLEELVTITVPKKMEKHLVKDLSPTEVTSRLQALASTIDSRGWAVKNVGNKYVPSIGVSESDRLIQPSTLPKEVPNVDLAATKDILDADANPDAKRLDQLIQDSTNSHHEEALAKIETARHRPAGDDSAKSGPNYLFMDSPDLTKLPDPNLASFGVAPPAHSGSENTGSNEELTPTEKAFLDKLEKEEIPPIITTHGHKEDSDEVDEQQLKLEAEAVAAQFKARKEAETAVAAAQAQAPMTAAEQSDKLKIARLAESNDLTVQTLAHEINRERDQNGNEEVIISLH